MLWVGIILGVALLAAFLYWQLIIAEGAYFGKRVVALLYNWSAHIYDRIKQYDPGYEQWFLARPLAQALFSFPNPVILDVATGTSRLARTLFREVTFRGRIIGLDYSRKMLVQALDKTKPWHDRQLLVWQDAAELPFPDNSFETVTCLEALEFMPKPEQVMDEMFRVLRPGGILLTTNRIGNDTRWMPGRTQGQADFEVKLHSLGLEMVRTQVWQEEYDLVWGMKPGVCAPRAPKTLDAYMRCPICQSDLTKNQDGYRCDNGHHIPVNGQIIDMEAAR